MGIFLSSIFFFIIFQILIIQQFMLHLPVEAKEVLVLGDELDSQDSTSTLASGKFSLGFFTIIHTELTYLGIWYTNQDTRVWVANRDNPINSSTNGKLMIDESGTLKVVISGTNTTLFNVSNGVVNSGNNNTSVVLQLEDSGNLVLRDTIKNRILWQSFDHPTDTLLPGMKLGYNLTTGQNWTLTSWFSEQNPASGVFRMQLEPFQDTARLRIYRRGQVYWTRSPWNNATSHIYDYFDVLEHVKNSTFVSDASGIYIVFHTYPSRIQLTSMGRITDGSDYSKSFITYFCYQSDQLEANTQDCTYSSTDCRTRARDRGFTVEHGDLYGGYIYETDTSSNISLSDCKEKCWNDCKCKGFSLIESNGTGCQLWGGHLHFEFTDSAPYQIGVVNPLYKPPKNKTWIWILVSTTGVVICALIAGFCYVRIRRCMLEGKERRKRDDYIHQLKSSDSFNYGDILEKGIKDTPDIKIFSLGAILTATDNFSIENKLGQGGYGPVYKGKLFDGREIAIKKLSKTSGQGINEFKSELILISKLQHTNLVRLYGCCIHQEEKMLIYEYMPNKSLDFFLFAEDKKGKMDWRIRFNIIEGVAQGLLYLHKYSRMRVIHRDLKVSNVLLDENMNPKIADFGLARIFQENVTEAITNRVVGTYGYMAPEYAMEGTFSIKSDVFSYGVLILEIVSGKRNSRFNNIERSFNLVEYAWDLWKKEAALELKDEALDDSFDLKQLLVAIHVGLLCVQDNADDRPTMQEVIIMLNNEITDLPNPNQPVFITAGRQPVADSSSKNNLVSLNGLSISMMEAR